MGRCWEGRCWEGRCEGVEVLGGQVQEGRCRAAGAVSPKHQVNVGQGK